MAYIVCMKHPRTLRSKIMTMMIICFLLITIPAMVILFESMNKIVFEKVRELDRQWIESKLEKMDEYVAVIIHSAAWISENKDISEILGESSDKENMDIGLVRASNQLKTYIQGSAIASHINKAVLFNDKGVFFEYANRVNGSLADVELIKAKEEFGTLQFKQGMNVKILASRCLNKPKENCIAAYAKMQSSNSWMYMEVNTSLLDFVFDDNPLSDFYLYNTEGWSFPSPVPEKLLSNEYEEISMKDEYIGLTASYFIKKRSFPFRSLYGLTSLILIICSVIILITLTSNLITKRITKPVAILNAHIRYLTDSDNYGVRNSDIERGSDEIAGIGESVNIMSASIYQLLERNKKLYEEKKNKEIAMLQMQINPHFLYNTLESIHYLASIQRATGITDMSRGLSRLLKNMAKGNGDHIPLSKELELLDDYNRIQQVRYMGMYDVYYEIPEALLEYRIRKFTLQPLLENAIFHGIEPKGTYGSIRIRGWKDSAYLYIAMIDNGVGISKEKLETIFRQRSHDKAELTGVGINNVDERLKLIYGKECGLSYESRQGEGTTVTVKLVLEV